MNVDRGKKLEEEREQKKEITAKRERKNVRQR